MWPAILAFAERHLKLSDRVCSCYSFLTGLMSMVNVFKKIILFYFNFNFKLQTIPLVLGQISLKIYPLTLMALEAGFLTTSLLMFITVRLWIWKDGSRADGSY